MTLLKDALSVILPDSCTICGKRAEEDDHVIFDLPEGFHICRGCLSRLTPYPHDRRFLTCLSEPYKGDPHPLLVLYMPFPYDDFFASAVRGIKFAGKKETASFMGSLLGRIASKDKIEADAIVPVPLSEGRLKERGYNQAEVMGAAMSEIMRIPLWPSALVRTRETKRQTELADDIVRSENVRGAFSVSPDSDITDLRLILADDVVTTGNTLHEAACALYKAGASSVICVALCGNRNARNAEPF